jgi:iron(II)-dependent oxidoreductase
MSFFAKSKMVDDSDDAPSDPPDLDARLGADELDRLLHDRRYGLILNRHFGEPRDERIEALAWLAMEKDMALVPRRVVQTGLGASDQDVAASIPAFYLDRYTVTNKDFLRFVNAGGYCQTDYWPEEIWPNLLQFVDATGFSGPRYWSNGKPPRGKELHPVVGVSWFEARAYALWCGKRLPTAQEWEYAGCWSHAQNGTGSKIRYPWGSAFEPDRTNTWAGGEGQTVPVDHYYDGCTPNGVYQLIGNVWEWVATQYHYDAKVSGLRVTFEQPMVEIRGGAFDTYFESQASCQFRTGQPFLYRAPNVGFRCCLPADQLKDPPSPSAFV